MNPTGKFVIGGPDGDCGLTGRKIIVDTYGGAAPHGGGAFSGKDPTKVDRSAAYACRYLAKNVVAAGLADRCTIQISYAIGISHPLSVYVDLQGTGKDVDETRLETVLRELMNLSPRGIREHLHLNRPIYVPTSAYGHFGREPDEEKGTFTWEKTDLVPALKAAFGPLKPTAAEPAAAEAAAGPAVRPRPRPQAAASPGTSARRRRCRAWRFRQALAADPLAAFPRARRALWLEVGFGGGEHALAQIAAHPDVGLIACEVFENGICSLLSRLVPEGGEADAPLPPNLRLWPDDARLLLRRCRMPAWTGCSCCSPIRGRRRATPSAASCIRRCCRCWRACCGPARSGAWPPTIRPIRPGWPRSWRRRTCSTRRRRRRNVPPAGRRHATRPRRCARAARRGTGPVLRNLSRFARRASRRPAPRVRVIGSARSR